MSEWEVDECCDPQHMILLLEPKNAQREFPPHHTLCASCLVDRLDKLPALHVVQALQDIMLSLQYTFSPVLVKHRTNSLHESSFVDVPAQGCLSSPPWDLLLRFAGLLQDLGAKICRCISLHHHMPLYKAGLSVLALVFTLLEEATESGLFCHTECLGMDGRSYDFTVQGHTTLLSQPPVGLSICLCETVLAGLSEEVKVTADDFSVPLPLLLLTDLAEASPPFLWCVAEHCVPHMCSLTTALTDAFRVELLLYLLHLAFEACAKHPVWLESLANALPASSWGVRRSPFLTYLTWALETFRGEEPVVANALYLTRFVLQYGTTRTALFTTTPLPHHDAAAGTAGGKSDSYGLPLSDALGLARNLIILLLHLNGDVVVAAAEALRELFVEKPLLGECPDLSDYIIEALRTASADTAPALVGLLNNLPSGSVPYGPLLCVLFEVSSISGKAFEDAVRGPHFVDAVIDRHTNLNDVAEKIVRSVRDGSSVSFHCFLLECLCLERACKLENCGGASLLPETISVLTNTLLHVVWELCGEATAGTEAGGNYHADQQLFPSEFRTIPCGALHSLICVAAFLLPGCEVLLMQLVIGLLGEALRQFQIRNDGGIPDTRLVFDSSLGDAILKMGSTVIRRLIGKGDDFGIGDSQLEQKVCHLLRGNLLTLLLSVPSSFSDLRVSVMNDFLLLAPANRDLTGEDGQIYFTFVKGADGLMSPQLLVNNSLRRHPHWAASFLLALATAGCEQPLGSGQLDSFLFEQLSLVPLFTEGARQVFASGGYSGAYRTGDDVIPSEDRCSVAEFSALKVSLAIHKWGGEQPQRDISHLNACVSVSGASVVSEELRLSHLQMFRSAEPQWLEALGARTWGKALLAALVSSAIIQIESDREQGRIEEAHDYLFTGSQHRDKDQVTLCSLVVNHAAGCGLFLSLLFNTLRRRTASNDHPLSCRIISFLCRCLHAEESTDTTVIIEFVRLLLEQHLTPLLLYREAAPFLVGHAARLVALSLSRLPVSVASCCDHTLFKWALQNVRQPSGQVYMWMTIFLLLRRAHRSEFALRHEVELGAELNHMVKGGDVSPCIEAARATVCWMVEGEMMRCGVGRHHSAVQIPLNEWSKVAPGNLTLRAFVICSVEHRMKCCWSSAMNQFLEVAAPLLLTWVSELMFYHCETVAASRVCHELLGKFPHLSCSLEALGLFFLLTGVVVAGTRSEKQGNDPVHSVGVAEGGWVFAALLNAWPSWAEAGGLREAVAVFLSGLGEESKLCNGAKRPRELLVSGSAATVAQFNRPSLNVYEAVRAVLEACELQAERCGPFPVNRAKDFYLRWPVEAISIDMERDIVFRAAEGGGELMVAS
ncbi:hypothetical protein DPX39_090085600 [Trypanosoma brucei equiperdum]|uniref:Uncharacterized protein n=1 Tax=Trypanosoma brucei equiperdum TaxID=630700 RepID=A0A3L6L100_9TRYP|nr:hypothetical protein DPX39_090085600 [Trypanosoma brucei equiperdum]